MTGIVLLTGNPGSGKTLFAVDLIDKAAKAGNRPIFTNITGISIPGVQPLPESADWRSLPDRSLVVFDECQDIEDTDGHRPYAATGQAGLARDGRLSELRQHRKREFELVFITQHPTFCHHEIRKITDTHHHFLRVMGLQRSTKYTFTGSYCLNPEKPEERRRGDKEFWRYPKHLFGVYFSAQAHHIGFKMPRKVAMIGAAVVATCALGVWFLLGRVGLGDESVLVQQARAEASAGQGGASALGVAAALPLPAEFEWTRAPTLPRISGCAVLTTSCRCWDAEGAQLALTHAQCLNVATGPLPMHFAVAQAPIAPAGESEAGEASGPAGVRTKPSQVGSPHQGDIWGRSPETMRADWSGG